MMDSDEVLAAHRAHFDATMGEVPESLEQLAAEAPAYFHGYAMAREWLLRPDEDAALPLRYRHLLCSILDCANGNLGGALNHGRAAARNGLTADEYRDAAVVLIITRGTPAWGAYGRKVLAMLREEEAH